MRYEASGEIIDLISSSVPGLDHMGWTTTDIATLSIDDVSLLLIDGIHICDRLRVPFLFQKVT